MDADDATIRGAPLIPFSGAEEINDLRVQRDPVPCIVQGRPCPRMQETQQQPKRNSRGRWPADWKTDNNSQIDCLKVRKQACLLHNQCCIVANVSALVADYQTFRMYSTVGELELNHIFPVYHFEKKAQE